MTDRGQASRRPPRGPMAPRARRRWAVAAGVAACWAVLLGITGSIVAATLLLAFIAAFAVLLAIALRALGVTREHPWVQQLRSRPWRDGQEVLRLALRHLPEVFVITPGGTLLAPNSVELWLNPRDFGSLSEVMDPGLVNDSATEVYEEEVAAHGARFGRPGVAEVRVVSEPSVLPGRYRLRQARPVDTGAGYQPVPDPGPVPLAASVPGSAPSPQPAPSLQPAPFPQAAPTPVGPWPYARDGWTGGDKAAAATVVPGLSTVAERGPVPLLRLVTGDSVAQTRVSGARAGRGDVELPLPAVLTVSRQHARFTYADGQWWVENLGRNGLSLSGVPLEGQRPVRDGDTIRWGAAAEAPVSRVEIS